MQVLSWEGVGNESVGTWEISWPTLDAGKFGSSLVGNTRRRQRWELGEWGWGFVSNGD